MPFKRGVKGFTAAGPLSALANWDNLVAIGGKNVLQILKVPEIDEECAITEEMDLGTAGLRNMNFSNNDVCWVSRNKLATAATNGAIVIWNLTAAGTNLVDKIICEHVRAVNRVESNQEGCILSASSDGTVKFWDLRVNPMARITFDGKAEAVRDVKFNPVNPYWFAAAFDNGAVQIWDIRVNTACYQKFSAHHGLALAIAWDHSGKFIATGGRDRKIRVWEVKKNQGRPVKTCTIPTISGIGRLQWRPDHDTEIASTSHVFDSRVQIWDIHRPFIPKYYVDEHRQIISGFVWKNSGEIWTCSKDKQFLQVNETCFVRQLDSLNASCIHWNPYGELALAIDEKYRDFNSFGQQRFEFTQSTGVVQLPGFDYLTFRHMAEHYSLEKGSFEYNAKVGPLVPKPKVKQYRKSQTWRVLSLFCGRKNLDEDGLFSFPEFTGREDEWSNREYLERILNYYAEEGDVQFCTTVLLVLGLDYWNDYKMAKMWLQSYLELLDRFKLNSVIGKIRQAYCKLNDYKVCSNCFAPIVSSNNWRCENCQHLLKSCAICNNTKPGSFGCCPGCQHGGHLEHLEEWLNSHRNCPVVGCGHCCEKDHLLRDQVMLQHQRV